MNAIEKIIERASALNGTVVLPEGMDARVITAACACVDRKICTPVVLGTAEEIAAAEAKAGLKLADRNIKVIDYTQGDAELEEAYLAAWNAKEGQVRLAVARRRAARLGVPPPEVPAVVADTRIEPAVNAAFEEINPLRREQALDRLRWQLVDEMQGVQPISENVVLAYAVKLRLALRLQSLDETAGRAKFDELTH